MADKTEEELRDEVDGFLRRNFPQIAMHGGSHAIEEVNPDEGMVTIRLGGACSGCGISPMTIQAIQQRLPDEIPEIDTAHAITGEGRGTISPSGPSSDGGIDDDGPDAPF